MRKLASCELLPNQLGVSDLKLTTKILQGIPLLLEVCTDILTEDNNRNFARGPHTDLFFFFSSFPPFLSEYNNRNFARGSPTKLYSLNLIWSKWYEFH